ncbi:MAG TPA: deoxyribonuclease IV [Candidatus Woesebacteria bacterium]|nr:deoxyribonuclease IV [Candidatus Woesebacteria bacterium]
MNYKIGAHISSAGGYYKALEKIIKIGGNCLQIFSSSPMMWVNSKVTDEDIQKFVELKNKLQIDPIYFHACYLINCADSKETGKKSVQSLIFELNLAKKMGVRGSIVHTGSFKEGKTPVDNYLATRTSESYKTLILNIKTVLAETPQNTFLILENAGNRKIGRTIDQLVHILEDVHDDRLRICLDTCHLHAAGYDLNSPDKFGQFITDLDAKIGLHKLEVVHMNDSKDSFGTLRDRHENIGKGYVGVNVFKNLLNDNRTKHIPFILEVPGLDGKGPDKENLDIIKQLLN